MKKILVPTDFSAESDYALQAAYQLAQRQKATVHLAHVLNFPLADDGTPGGPVEIVPGGFLNQAKKEALVRLKKFIKKKKPTDVRITHEVLVGNPYQSITRALMKKKVDLVVMGSKGASGAKEIIVGSNAERMVRFSPSPVLIIKDKTDLSQLKNIVYATALRGREQPVLRVLSKLQRVFDAQLHLVRINTIANFLEDPSAMEQLKNLAKSSRLKNYTLNTFSDIREEEGIIHFADEVKADLIAVSTHARRGLLHLLGGSIAEGVANHAKYPVWTMSLHPSSELLVIL